MAQEMALILSTPIEQLVPQLIAWNNSDLMASVKERLTEYVGKIYDEKSITEAKSDKAQLNNFAKALNAERIRIGKIYDAPLQKFKTEVDEVIHAVEEVSATIDEQVKAYEQVRQDARLAENKEYFASVLPETLAQFVSYEKIAKKEWLNASKTPAAVRKEIDAAVQKIISELATIDALGDKDADMKAEYFQTLDLAATIQAHERRKADKARIQAAQEAARAAEAAAQEVADEEPAKPQEAAQKLYTVSFAVTGTNAQLKALAEFLRANNLEYKKL